MIEKFKVIFTFFLIVSLVTAGGGRKWTTGVVIAFRHNCDLPRHTPRRPFWGCPLRVGFISDIVFGPGL